MIDLVWTERARRDLRRQVEYLAQFDPDAAERVRLLVEARAQWLCDVPRAGQSLPGGGRLRHFGVRGTSLILLYQPGRSTLSIASVVHAEQNWR